MGIDEILKSPISVDVLSNVVGLTFAYAVVAKVIGFRGLVLSIRAYELVPYRLASHAAIALILCEGVISFAHVTGVALNILVPITLLVLIGFIVVTALALTSGVRRPCLCFGANDSDQVDAWSLFRLGIILLCELGLLANYELLGPSASDGESILRSLTVLLVSALIASLASWILCIPKLRNARKVLDS